MPRPNLPTRTEDAWEGAFLMNPPRPVHAVACAGGRVVAGGHELYLMRAGTDRLAARKLPESMTGPALAVAAEPHAPWRIALAPQSGGLHIFEAEGDVIELRRDPPNTEACATHLAWEPSGLHARWDDGSFSRIRSVGDQDYVVSVVVSLSIDALASDGRGSVVALSIDPLTVFRFRGGDVCDSTFFSMDLPEGAPVWLAAAADQVAFSVGGYGTYRSDASGLGLCEAHEGGGAIAFQGTRANAALLGAMTVGALCSVVRMELDGSARRVFELEATGCPPAQMCALAWDEPRLTLWAASPEVGLMRHTPRAARKQRRPLS